MRKSIRKLSTVTRVGLDLAKRVFQVHAVGAKGEIVVCVASIRKLSTVTRVGLDLAKRVFQVHAVGAKGEIVVARRLTRSVLTPFFAELPPCVVAMEAVRLGAHHWGRALIGPSGHEVRLLPPAHVKPYVGRNKNDAVDAAAICEAMSRPGQRFVPVRALAVGYQTFDFDH